jgi:hypothetical protein
MHFQRFTARLKSCPSQDRTNQVFSTHPSLGVRVYVILHLQVVEHIEIGVQIIVGIEGL